MNRTLFEDVVQYAGNKGKEEEKKKLARRLIFFYNGSPFAYSTSLLTQPILPIAPSVIRTKSATTSFGTFSHKQPPPQHPQSGDVQGPSGLSSDAPSAPFPSFHEAEVKPNSPMSVSDRIPEIVPSEDLTTELETQTTREEKNKKIVSETYTLYNRLSEDLENTLSENMKVFSDFVTKLGWELDLSVTFSQVFGNNNQRLKEIFAFGILFHMQFENLWTENLNISFPKYDAEILRQEINQSFEEFIFCDKPKDDCKTLSENYSRTSLAAFLFLQDFLENNEFEEITEPILLNNPETEVEKHNFKFLIKFLCKKYSLFMNPKGDREEDGEEDDPHDLSKLLQNLAKAYINKFSHSYNSEDFHNALQLMNPNQNLEFVSHLNRIVYSGGICNILPSLKAIFEKRFFDLDTLQIMSLYRRYGITDSGNFKLIYTEFSKYEWGNGRHILSEKQELIPHVLEIYTTTLLKVADVDATNLVNFNTVEQEQMNILAHFCETLIAARIFAKQHELFPNIIKICLGMIKNSAKATKSYHDTEIQNNTVILFDRMMKYYTYEIFVKTETEEYLENIKNEINEKVRYFDDFLSIVLNPDN